MVKRNNFNQGPNQGFKKGHIMSMEVREKISKARKGQKLTAEHRNKISMSMKNKNKTHVDNCQCPFCKNHRGELIPWHKGKKGIKPFRLSGFKITEETREKMSLAKKGKKPYEMTDEIRKKMSLARSGAGNISKKCGHVRNFKYKEWRIKVFIRDNFTCVECSQVGGPLEAHHIKSYKHYPELRYDVNNGVTLCKPCHSLTDNYKGRSKGKCI